MTPLTQYLQDTPAGTQCSSSLQSLFTQLEKFQLTVGELQMIANQRPNSVLQLLCILFDCERRFTEEEMAVSWVSTFSLFPIGDLVICLGNITNY
ncbi:hypothetical protein Gasu_32280 isoform 2 [Galdieria sulphuraria]|uniref:DNA-directed RNA polymerase III subunit RPC9 n=1 Tax=Galdieria sulphuraria TaxID=130081 RepID=M2WZA7_GALSU|nr:hypothetical protein Gasu_32280 isoform 2 [Galdieria sulphuraria]EME29405.1 hypothetical protein Gasu_32280 isoform 2 [Galdieria sulphuraria]|eukprot:XP_005705925.1 hypothetical protein isoform 2 [Galdieria sulphuraria]